MSEEVSVTTRNVNKQANALAKARERRRELDKARDEQDRRVEQATATALVALEARKAAELSLREATEAWPMRCVGWSARTSASSARRHCSSSTRQRSGA